MRCPYWLCTPWKGVHLLGREYYHPLMYSNSEKTKRFYSTPTLHYVVIPSPAETSRSCYSVIINTMPMLVPLHRSSPSISVSPPTAPSSCKGCCRQRFQRMRLEMCPSSSTTLKNSRKSASWSLLSPAPPLPPARHHHHHHHHHHHRHHRHQNHHIFAEVIMMLSLGAKPTAL